MVVNRIWKLNPSFSLKWSDSKGAFECHFWLRMVNGFSDG